MTVFRKVQISLNDGFKNIINDLEGIGYSLSEATKAGLRLLHRKEFPPYPGSKKGKMAAAEGMDETEICEGVFGGEVIEENGVRYCQFKQGTMTTRVPLSAIKDQLK